MCQAQNIYCHKYTPLDFTSNTPISQDFLQIQDKSTNETATLCQSVCKHRIILQTILPHPSQNGVIGLWDHFLTRAMILHIKNNASVLEWKWQPANIQGAVRRCAPSATSIGWKGIDTSHLLIIFVNSTAIVINYGCASRQTQFCLLRMNVSQDQTGWQGR